MAALLTVNGLCVDLHQSGARSRVIDEVSFDIEAGETLALVGESGCGKSMTAQALMRILPEPTARIAGGEILLGERDLVREPEWRLRGVRGKEIGMIFQEPMSALNPVLTIGEQMVEAIRAHRDIGRRQALDEAQQGLAAVQIADARAKLSEYPHRLSGGMRQRVMIAMALASRPRLMVADEPTTALDVTVQAQILRLLREARDRTGMGMLLITHNLGVVAEIADRVAVMYAGRIVEIGSVEDVLLHPAHPYTQGLLRATPRFDPGAGEGPQELLFEIRGMVPPPHRRGASCTFADRCDHAGTTCRQQVPPLAAVSGRGAHRVACTLNGSGR
ncbi:MAG: ABC transporter ATP-binding protein [Burkholderiaceae bacterium]